jgi:hypothetical protein
MKRAPLFEPSSKLPACRPSSAVALLRRMERRFSFDLQSSPCKSKTEILCDLRASSEAGGEIPFLSSSMNRNHTVWDEYVSVFMKVGMQFAQPYTTRCDWPPIIILRGTG